MNELSHSFTGNLILVTNWSFEFVYFNTSSPALTWLNNQGEQSCSCLFYISRYGDVANVPYQQHSADIC